LFNPTIDIIIPVYDEGDNILPVLKSIKSQVKTEIRILICYDFEEDRTLSVLRESEFIKDNIVLVKNKFHGAHGAVRTGFGTSKADAVITYMADDDYNAGLIDHMVSSFKDGNQMVVPSRFIPGGSFVGCRWPKNYLVRLSSWSMHYLARVPVHDATNGFRLFSRRLLDTVQLESDQGFTYSIELLVKCHRLGWKMAELPTRWYERKSGQSKFKIYEWVAAYLKWYRYAFETTYLRRNSI
jgi:dolichol-phosphate mannosyltransferase